MEHDHAGHRQRIIQKLESGVLLDHELLEIMLFPLLPRKNTNDLAHRLLAKFGSVVGVYSASMAELQKVRGVGLSIAGNIYCAGLIFRKYFEREKKGFDGKFESKSFIPYVKELYASVSCEMLDLFLLGEDGCIVKSHRFTDEEESEVVLNPVEFSKVLIDEQPSGVVLVHNHPAGEAVPSEADDEMTKCCQLLCNMHGSLLCDHIIYAPNGVYSYYLSGQLAEISKSYSVSGVTAKEERVGEEKKSPERKA